MESDVEVMQKWAKELTKDCDHPTLTKDFYDNIIKHSVDIGVVKSDQDAIKYYLTHLKESKPEVLGVIGTVYSCNFMNGGIHDPDRNRPDLILSVHGLSPGDVLKIGSFEYNDILGTKKDFVFFHPFNQCGSPYSPGSILQNESITTPRDIYFRGLWIMDSKLREKCGTYSDKTYKITYSLNAKAPAFCIYRGQHILWEAKNYIF
jgi:hypothetical protein